VRFHEQKHKFDINVLLLKRGVPLKFFWLPCCRKKLIGVEKDYFFTQFYIFELV